MKAKTRETLFAMVFISPWIIGFLAFTLIPIIMSFSYSLTDFNVISTPNFIGFSNYTNLFKDSVFLTSLYNTMFIVIVGVSITTVCSLTSSILLNNKKIKGLSFFRIASFIPTLMPLIINCILWLWLLQPDKGLINAVLKIVGINGPGWIASPTWSKPGLILMMVWGCGGTIIIYLAGLQEIPETLYESAELDGASMIQKNRYITIPMLSPVILYNVVTMVIGAFQWFAEPLVMTEGGPSNSTMFYSLYLYQNAFQFFKMGYASAMAWVLLIIALIIIFLLFKGLNKYSTD